MDKSWTNFLLCSHIGIIPRDMPLSNHLFYGWFSFVYSYWKYLPHYICLNVQLIFRALICNTCLNLSPENYLEISKCYFEGGKKLG